MKKCSLVVVFLILVSLSACKSPETSSFDFPLPASADLKKAFFDERGVDESYVIGTDDTVEQTAQFFRDSMQKSNYELLEENNSVVDNVSNIVLTYKKSEKTLIISILSIPIEKMKTTISIIIP